MAFQGKTFAAGHFTNSLSTLYSVPNGNTAYIKFFHIHNNEVIEDTITIYASKSGVGDFVIGKCTLITNESADVIDKDTAIVLQEGDAIKAQTVVSSSGITYFISGGVEF